MRIQHNIMAMSAYRNYTNNVSAMKKNLEKLSSGYKINRAGDDAAGLAISEKMRAQITGLETAQKNAKDGISLVQTAEGALTEVHDMLNRMVELATMSANGTYDNETDRAQLQKELDQLRSEVDRIADSSNFNGIKLLDGSMDAGTSRIELVGGQDMTVASIKDGMLVTKDPAKGKYSIDFSQANLTNTGTLDRALTITLESGVTGTITVEGGKTLGGKDLAEALKTALSVNASVIDGISFTVKTEGSKLVFEMEDIPDKEFDSKKLVGTLGTATSVNSNQGEQFQVTPEQEAVPSTGRVYAQGQVTLTGASITDGSAIKIGDTTYVFAVGSSSKYADMAAGSATIIDLTDQTAGNVDVKKAAARLAEAAKDNKTFFVGANVGGDGVISLTEKEGGVDYKVNNLAGSDGKSMANGSTTGNDCTSTDWKGLVQFGTAGKVTDGAFGQSLTLQIGDTADSYNQLKVNIKDMHVSALGIDKISIADQSSAQSAIDAIRKAINQVSDVRGTLGATQNRLDHTLNNLSVMTENIQDAESTIRDTDVAEEMMAYTKNNILIQSAQAMLAQANQVPQGVLQLLQ